MKLFGKIRGLCHLFATTNVPKTIYFNFKMFPIRVAARVPVYLAYGVKMMDVKRGTIVLKNVKRGGVRIGYLQYPMKPNSGNGTLLRFGSPNARLILGGEEIQIYRGCSIVLAYEGVMSIGNDTIVNQDTILYCSNRVVIGDHFRLGWCSQLYDSNFHFVYDEQSRTIAERKKSVVIGRSVWLGNHCTVAAGAHIPDCSIVAANSLVNKDFSDMTTKGNFFAGSPAKLKRTGMYRVFNVKKEWEFATYFKQHPETKLYKCPDNFDLEECLTRKNF